MAEQGRPPRERMVYSAAQLVRARGVTGTGVRDVVEHAGAPRGSFQHYFPGGKDQLVGEALLWSGEFAARHVASYAAARRPTPAGLFAHLVKPWQAEFERRGFERGCPVMATAGDVAGGESSVTEPLRAALTLWETAVAEQLARMNLPERRARRLATLMISTLEGAIMAARVRRSMGPLTDVVTEMVTLLRGAHPGSSR